MACAQPGGAACHAGVVARVRVVARAAEVGFGCRGVAPGEIGATSAVVPREEGVVVVISLFGMDLGVSPAVRDEIGAPVIVVCGTQ